MLKSNYIQLDFSHLIQEIRAVIQEEVNSALRLNNADEVKADVLTREETCKLLNVSKTTLYNWHNQAILVPTKIGGRVYYRKQDVLNKLS